MQLICVSEGLVDVSIWLIDISVWFIVEDAGVGWFILDRLDLRLSNALILHYQISTETGGFVYHLLSEDQLIFKRFGICFEKLLVESLYQFWEIASIFEVLGKKYSYLFCFLQGCKVNSFVTVTLIDDNDSVGIFFIF
jgi:hypothetical protein